MRTNWEIGLYAHHFEKVVKWYSLAFQSKHPSKEDEKAYHLFSLIADDLIIQDKEEKEEFGRE